MYTVEELTGISQGIWAVLDLEGVPVANTVSAHNARRIARALNLEAAMREAREALGKSRGVIIVALNSAWEGPKQDWHDHLMIKQIDQALAALDRAGEV